MANFLGVLCNAWRENGTTAWERCFMSLEPGTKDCIAMAAELLPHESDFTLHEVRENVVQAVAEHQRLREVLSPQGLWEEVEVDIDRNHLRWIPESGRPKETFSKGQEEDPAIVAALHNMPAFDDLEARTPRWQVLVTQRKVLFHVHHAAVDGVGIAVIAATLLLGKSLQQTVQLMMPAAERSKSRIKSEQACSGCFCQTWVTLASCCRHVAMPLQGLLCPKRATPISVPATAAVPSCIRYFRTGPYPLALLRAAAKENNVTVNSVLLTALVAGLGEYCKCRDSALPPAFAVAIPISFKSPDPNRPEKMKANNNFSTFVLQAPQTSSSSVSSDEESFEASSHGPEFPEFLDPGHWSLGNALGAWAAQGMLSLLPMTVVRRFLWWTSNLVHFCFSNVNGSMFGDNFVSRATGAKKRINVYAYGSLNCTTRVFVLANSHGSNLHLSLVLDGDHIAAPSDLLTCVDRQLAVFQNK
mmetsp:Transcript_9989/g.24009  ORF Transcript_9989/g.24009 Transcript_9989/m.24009 type:complete len:472 (-) Transcript_9989:84-1499(-)